MAMDPQFQAALANAIEAAYQATGERLDIVSGYRTPEHQADLYRASGGSGMVGTPHGSKHVQGLAADLGHGGALGRSMTPALQWVHDHASDFGLSFPLMHGLTPKPEPWHVEPIWARGGAPPVSQEMLSQTMAPAQTTTPMPPLPSAGPSSMPVNPRDLEALGFATPMSDVFTAAAQPAQPMASTPTPSIAAGPLPLSYRIG